MRKLSHQHLSGVSTLALVAMLPHAAHSQTPAETLEEVVVTAQHRSENLQTVPISVSAITLRTLSSSGIDGSIAIPQIVPSVQISRSGLSGIFFIRGVGNLSGAVGEEGANAMYVDDVYIADQFQGVFKFNNIQRIEVLKGPQGTLFGRNASGGLVNVITKEPGTDSVVNGQLRFGNYDAYSGQLYVASPIATNLSADIALTGENQPDGWGRNFFDGSQAGSGYNLGVRSKIVWNPNDTTKIVIAGDYSNSNDTLSSGLRLVDGAVGLGGTVSPGGWNINSNDPRHGGRQTAWGVTATARFDIGRTTLTSISAGRGSRIRSYLDGDAAQLPLVTSFTPNMDNTFQEEIRLASSGTEPLSWLTGLFFLRESAGVSGQTFTGQLFGGPNSGYSIFANMRTKSYAGFGELTYAVTRTTHITGGLRYTLDDRELTASQVAINLPAGSPLYNAFSLPQRNDSLSYGEFTYRLAVRQDVTDDINVYASYNRGFKSGLWALTAPADPPVKPQYIDAYEIGLKSELFDRRLRLNLAGFHYYISNYQVRTAPIFGTVPRLLNAAKTNVNGFEAEFEAAPTASFRLFGAITALKSRFSSFPKATYSIRNPAVCTPGGSTPGYTTGPLTGGNKTCFGDATGNDTPLAPRFTGNVGASYTVGMGNGGAVEVSALYSYNDGSFFEADNRLRQKPYSLVNGSIEYRPTQHWAVGLWGTNLTNTQHYATLTGSSVGDIAVLAPPRMYGINAKFDY